MYYTKPNSNELYHYGVLGMKWGIRRSARNFVSKLSGSKNKKKSTTPKKTVKTMSNEELRAKTERLRLEQEYKNVRNQGKTNKTKSSTQIKKKSAKDMTDDELRTKINRLEMERKYDQLNPKQVSAGNKFVQDVLVNHVGKRVVVPVAEDLARQYLKDLGMDKLGLKKEDKKK